MCYSCITTPAIWVYSELVDVFADISFPISSISKIIDLVRPADEWAEFAFSSRRNAENEHWKTRKKQVH